MTEWLKRPNVGSVVVIPRSWRPSFDLHDANVLNRAICRRNQVADQTWGNTVFFPTCWMTFAIFSTLLTRQLQLQPA